MLKKLPLALLLFFVFSTKIIAQKDYIGHFTLGGQSGINMPLGTSLSSQQSEKIGLAWGLNFSYFPSNRFAMTLNFKHLSSILPTSSNLYKIPISRSVISIGMEHYFNAEGDLRPFLGFELGISINNFDMPVPFKNPQYVPNPYSSYLGAGKAGLAYQLNDTWSFKAEGSLHMLFDPGDTSYWQAADGAIFSPVKRTLSGTLGIVFHFKAMESLTQKGKGIHKHVHEH